MYVFHMGSGYKKTGLMGGGGGRVSHICHLNVFAQRVGIRVIEHTTYFLFHSWEVARESNNSCMRHTVLT